MNNTFSFSRFCAYAKAELFLHRIAIISALSVFIGITLLASIWDLVFHVVLTNGFLIRPSMPETMGYVAMIILAAGAFKIFQKPGGGTFAMQMPISTLEKFTARFILHIIIVPMLALFIPRLVWDICHASFANTVPVAFGTYTYIWEIWATTIFVQSTFFLGAIVWRKQQLLKVIGVWVAFAILCVGVVYICKNVYHITREDIAPLINFLQNSDIYIGSVMTIGFLALAWAKFRKIQIMK